MKKIALLFLMIVYSYSFSYSQVIWKDTLRTYINAKHFKLPPKMVEVRTGKAIMYFSQKDYWGREVEVDTFKIEQKFVNEEVVSALLKKGKVKITNRFNNAPITRYSHRLIQYGSMCDRVFEFEGGVSFFRALVVTGIYDGIIFKDQDSTEAAAKKAIVPKRDFAAKEEFPSVTDQEPIKIQDYFKPDISKHKEYKGKFDDNGYKDTIGCRLGSVEGQTIFYFPEEGFDRYHLTDIETTMFGPGIYYYRNDSLFGIEAIYEADIAMKKLKDGGLLFPSIMRTGDSTVFERGENRQVYTYLFKEDVTVNGKLFKDCVKFKMLSYWPETIYISYIWFAKDIGMIKWMRETGRVDELVEQY
jgi:hypothetical protein